MIIEKNYLKDAVDLLVKKYKCQAVLWYGSRSRGDATSKSDYDLMGIRKGGKKFRLAEKWNGSYLDVFIFPEKEILKVDENFLYMKGAKILFDKDNSGSRFIKKLSKATKKKYIPLPTNEINARRVWLHKMYERVGLGDIEGNYRRSWLHEALLADYFNLRRKRYWGSKQSFLWLKENDKKIYNLFQKTLANPTDLKLLKKLVVQVSELKMEP